MITAILAALSGLVELVQLAERTFGRGLGPEKKQYVLDAAEQLEKSLCAFPEAKGWDAARLHAGLAKFVDGFADVLHAIHEFPYAPRA